MTIRLDRVSILLVILTGHNNNNNNNNSNNNITTTNIFTTLHFKRACIFFHSFFFCLLGLCKLLQSNLDYSNLDYSDLSITGLFLSGFFAFQEQKQRSYIRVVTNEDYIRMSSDWLRVALLLSEISRSTTFYWLARCGMQNKQASITNVYL